jgi:hypothetical protein
MFPEFMSEAKGIRVTEQIVTAIPSQWRVVLFRVLAGLLGLVYLPGALLMTVPWAPSWMTTAFPNLSPLIWAWGKAAHPDIQRWMFAFSACVDEAIAVILLYLAWRPLGKPLLLQFLSLALVVALSSNIPFVGLGIAVGYSPLLVVILAYPELRGLLKPFWRGRISWTLLGLAAATAAFFIPRVWWALSAQLRGTDELALNYGWASLAEHLCNLWLIVFFSSFRHSGSRLLSLLVTFCFLFLGIAAIAVPANPGSWGLVGGMIAIIAGAASLVITAYDWKGSPRQAKN